MEPGEQQDIVARVDAVQCADEVGRHFHGRIWRALVSLTWRALPLGEAGTHDANRAQRVIAHDLRKPPSFTSLLTRAAAGKLRP